MQTAGIWSAVNALNPTLQRQEKTQDITIEMDQKMKRRINYAHPNVPLPFVNYSVTGGFCEYGKLVIEQKKKQTQSAILYMRSFFFVYFPIIYTSNCARGPSDSLVPALQFFE